MAGRRTLHLVDGSGYIFRAYYAIRPLSTSSGLPTNAVLGFARMVGRLVKDEKPELLGIVFDTPEKNFRHEIFADYKANREAPPEDLIPQFDLIRELVDAMDVPVLSEPGYEADDVIATLARQATEKGYDVVVVSGDKDLMQLVSDRVIMFDPMKDKRFDRAGVIEKFGVPPERVADVQALAGDTSDNIPGVPKVGPKGAAKLVNQFGDLDAVLEGVTTIDKPKAFERSVIEHADKARLSKRLAVLDDEAPTRLDLDALRYAAPRPEKLGPFLRRIEAFALMRDLGVEVAGDDQAPADEDGAPPRIDRSVYTSLLTLATLDEEIAAARDAKQLSIDLETTSLDANSADIVGVALCVPGRRAAYVPVAHRYLGAPKQLKLDAVLKRLRPVLEDEAVVKVGQNLKYDSVVFDRAGITLRGIGHDAMLAAYVLDPARPSYSLDALARELLGHETIHYKDLTGTGKKQIGFDEVAVEQATEYAAEDADIALRLCDMLSRRVHEAGLDRLYRELEIPLVPVLARMERAGVLVDVEHLAALSNEFRGRLATIEARAHELIGEPINLASPKQLAHVFFQKLGYPVVKKTKTGYSTDQSVLETLAADYELPGVILEHRLLAKLKSTYVDALPKMVNADTGRVHTSFNQTGTATGRLSSSAPNLQNIPIRSEDGRRIRRAFIAAPGTKLVSADYSQIELRVMAHLSGDPAF
ncbi:MAG: DNA polymerase I, partial [Myxococcota bacterium]